MSAIIKDLAQVNADLQEQKERVDNVDFKMITFSLAGKDYGVDIMNVKEIAKADKFTFVPNAASFVRGVYNLRGDIIPIIDLRVFFHLPADKKTEGLENMLILRINDHVYGTIVDKIDKVVGVNQENIQPPHPIFGDINIKYISGVVEKQGAVYIILDVIRIFSINKETDSKARTAETEPYFQPQVDHVQVAKIAAEDSAFGFIKESLAVLKGFYATMVNDSWLRKRFSDWSTGKTGDDLQLKDAMDADQFMGGFYSPDTGTFWSEEHAAAISKILPNTVSGSINVWNIGCGKGFETYSFACILRKKYPNARIKIWANDKDIMSVSQAPNMTFNSEDVPDYCKIYISKGSAGYSFNQTIKDSIIFEYSDILHDNPLPDLDMILARDIVSFLAEQDQAKVLSNFSEMLKSGGIAILGRNEELSGDGWRSLSSDPVSVYLHNI